MFYLIVKVTANADLLFVSKGFGHECYGVKCKRSTKSLPCPGSLFDILHEPDRSQFQALLNRCTSDLTGQPSSNQMFVFECKLLRRVNLDRNCECSDERDQPSYERMRACVSIRRFVDLTGRVHSYLLCVCKPWQPRMLKEVPLHYDDDDRTLNAANSRSNRNHSFSSRHSIEWKFLWIEEQSFLYLGYPTFELLGNSTFDYYHWGDLEPIANAHRQLLSGWDNCITTPKYRFLTKSQQWIWMQSSCTLVPNLPARSQIGGDPNPITVQTASADSRQANLILCENHVLQEATTAPFIRTAVNTLNKDLGRTSCPLTHDLSKPKTIIKDNRSGLSSDSSSVYPSSSSSNSSCLPQQFGQSCNSNVYPSTGSSSDQNTPSGASSTGQSLSGDSKSVATSSSLVVVQSTPGSFKSISKSAPDFDYIMSRRFELEKEIQEKQFQLQHLSEQLNNYQNASSN